MVAEMAPENKRMIGMFRHRGFGFVNPMSGVAAIVRKELGAVPSAPL